VRCVVDTNVVVDILDGDAAHGRESALRVKRTLRTSALLVPPFVYCELLSAGRTAERLGDFFRRARLNLQTDVSIEVYQVAAERYRQYLVERRAAPDVVECSSCGTVQRPRCSECGRGLAARRLPFDFLIGAFAVVAGDQRVLTRDQALYRRYFPDLILA
jgi:predicted nucleic acid-binding protein